MSQCIACHGPVDGFAEVRAPADGKLYPIVRCRQCASAFVDPRPSADYIRQFYQDEASGYGGAYGGVRTIADKLKVEAIMATPGLHARRLALRLKAAAPNDQLLDVGAGFGLFSHHAAQAGFVVTALEPTEVSRQMFLQRNGFAATASMLDADFAAANAGRFGAVVLNQVLEHVVDVDDAVRLIRATLAPSGVVSIAVPHFGSWLSRLQGPRDMFITPPEHLNFFSKAGLRLLFERHRFDTVRMSTFSQYYRAGLSAPMVRLINAALGLGDRAGAGLFIQAEFR